MTCVFAPQPHMKWRKTAKNALLHLVHTEGVTGSIPVAPTIKFKGLARNR